MSSNVQVTPRKRKAAYSDDTPISSPSKGKSRGPPTPNPPLAPFPTPPSSRHRKSHLAYDDLFLEPLPHRPLATTSKQATDLPPHLQTLLSLHHAFNLALSLHIATNPPVLPPHPPTSTSISLPNLTNYLSIRETVENSSNRRFGLPELSRLAWLYTWDGRSMPSEKLVSEKRKREEEDEDDNPFLVKAVSEIPTSSLVKVEGLSYLITPTRTLDAGGRRVYTYGLGIELELKQGETRQVLVKGKESGMGGKGQGGGAGAVGRWNAGGEGRNVAVREKLERWVELHGGWEPPVQVQLPTPSTSGSSTRTSIPPIPLLPLPHLPASAALPAGNLFSAIALQSAPGLTSIPKKNVTGVAGLADPFVLDETKSKGKVARPGSVEERRQAMMDRIKSRSGSSKTPIATLGSSIASTRRLVLSSAEQQEELKRRSTLSRLESIAEAVWMLFSGPPPGSSTTPTPPRGRRKAIPMSEVADVIIKSSKSPISLAEAQTSLQLLTELCPYFLTLKTIAKQEYLEVPQSIAPASPGSSLLTNSSPRSSPSKPGISSSSTAPPLEPPGSPTPSSRRLLLPALAGPASPGRVRRGGSLREVREKIRRELGE